MSTPLEATRHNNSTKLLILLPLRANSKSTFQYETPCISWCSRYYIFGSMVHKEKCKWLFSKHEAVFLFNLFFDNKVHFLMAVVYNDLFKGITVQKYLLFWQYGFFNPIHTNGGHQMTLWLDDGADRVNIDCFFMPLANCMKNDFGTDFLGFWMAQLDELQVLQVHLW